MIFMKKIHRKDAFDEVVRAIDRGEYETAQKMLEIVSWSIKEEKKNRAFTVFVLLKNSKEERVFKELCQAGKAQVVV